MARVWLGRQDVNKLKAAIKLMEPMGQMLEITQTCLAAHHPEGVVAGDCPICLRYLEEMLEIMRAWDDARAQVTEHWEIDVGA